MAWNRSASPSEVHHGRVKYIMIAAVPRQCGQRRSNEATLMIDSKLERRDFCVENGMPDLQKLAACFGGYNKITPSAAQWDEANEAYQQQLRRRT